MSPDPKRLLGGYATGSLTEDERRELLRAALEDQELFDAILEEEGLRELLESPEARQELLAALERPTAGERVRAWFGRPATFADLAVVAAAVFVAVGGYQVFVAEGPREVPPAATRLVARPVSAATRARLFALAPREAVPAGLEVEGTPVEAALEVPPGAALTLRLSLRGPAHVAVLAERGEGTVAQVYPSPDSPPALVDAPANGGPAVRRTRLVAPREPGSYRLRLVVAPVGVDLAAASPAELDRVSEELTLIDLTYEVTAP
jgi:hypothetical protein